MWPTLFERERQHILTTVGDRAASIEHIASSAVPGLGGRGEIDILLAARSANAIEECALLLRRIGYDEMSPPPEPSEGWQLMERPAPTPISVLIVLRRSYLRRWDVWFRDCLRHHPEMAGLYRRLKSQRAANFGADVEAYQEAKRGFIASIEEKVAYLLQHRSSPLR